MFTLSTTFIIKGVYVPYVMERNTIETGTEQDSDVTPANADIFAFADDGECATVWEVDRLSDTVARVNYYRCKAGLSEHDREETFSISADTSTEQFARELSQADPEEAVNLAREHFEDN